MLGVVLVAAVALAGVAIVAVVALAEVVIAAVAVDNNVAVVPALVAMNAAVVGFDGGGIRGVCCCCFECQSFRHHIKSS